ncbi:MAG TPA: protein kinase [Polyangium sp.]|nr:protein kinase [Polyangium sp.]
MKCLSASQVLLFLSHDLSADDRMRVEEHVDTCPDCRDLLVDAALFAVSGPGKRVNRKNESLPREKNENLSRPSMGAAGDLPIGTTLKHYEIIRQLGRGGMGRVYLARDLKLGRLVAIKLLVDHGGTSTARLLDEARATARCKHENIVVVHEVDEVQGLGEQGDDKPKQSFPYMVLEHIEGNTLRMWMQQRAGTPVPLEMVLDLVVPIVRALECAHEQGVVHRDLKPENVLISNSGTIKVLDFGIAKQVAAERTQSTSAGLDLQSNLPALTDGALMGTMPYMSPEQWNGERIDARSDIWAAGIMLFELATGEHPLEPLSLPDLVGVADLDAPMPSARDKLTKNVALADVIDRCLKKRKEERIGSAKELMALLEQLGTDTQQPVKLADDESPFAGLAAFQESDAARFFGRVDDIAAMLGRLRHQPLVTIAGASGAGKSSFVRAGVIPTMKRSGPDVEAFTLRPGARPLAALADVLAFFADTAVDAGAIEAEPEAIVELLRTQPGALGSRLRARARKRGNDHRILLFVDQLEELYTLGSEASERAAFYACLEGMADDASSPLRVIVTIRADFLDRVSEDRRFLSAMTQGLFFLPPMAAEAMQNALKLPLEAVRYRFESEGLLDEMIHDLAGMKSPLPLLQFTAAKLWEARDREKRLVTREAYHALGGASGALSTHADAVLSGMSPHEQQLARTILLRLVTPERTRAVVRLDELYTLSKEASVTEIVNYLAASRLVSIEVASEREGTTVELTHESLIERWAKLRQWLDGNEKDAEFLVELRNAASQWEKNGKAEGFLWRDQAATEAGQWLMRRRAEVDEEGAPGEVGLGEREVRYLEAVVKHAERSRRRRRLLTGGIMVSLAVVTFVVSFLGVQARSEARRADDTAQEARKNAVEAGKSAQEARKNAVEANKRTAEARNASRMASVREHLSDPTLAFALVREMEPAEELPPRWSEVALWAKHQGIAEVVLHHQAGVASAAFSPDGKHIITACYDNIVRVWNADGTGQPLLLVGHQDRVYSAVFSPDGKRIVTASNDKTARVWNADGTSKPLVFEGHQASVFSAAFSPDGKRIVTASNDKTAHVCNADGSGRPLVFEGHQASVLSARFSPDGTRIVTASTDKTARVWNADGTGKPLVFEGHRDGVNAAAFSPDGTRIVTASFDKTAKIWNADGTGTPRSLEGHQDRVFSVAFSPDGKRVVTGSNDKTARVWNVDGAGKPLVLQGHQAALFSVAFSHDGTRVVTASWDKTARVFNADGAGQTVLLEGHGDRVYLAAFSPDGTRVVTASFDKVARVFNANGTGQPLWFEGHKDRLYSAMFSPDGSRIVTASGDKTARVWNADGTGRPLVLEGHKDIVTSAAFSPNGKRIVTASWDKSVRVWNADGTGKPMLLEGHDDIVYSAAFSPDGSRIITASGDRTARIWNADGTGQPILLGGHKDIVTSAAFSPDGTRIVTASLDKFARVWKGDGTGEPLLLAHLGTVATGAVGAGAFSPDGTQIVTISGDKTVYLWNTDGTGEPAILRIPELDAETAVFSPDGTHIVTASHSGIDPATGKKKFWATVWPRLHRITGLDDPALWTATRYCPPIDLRKELLGMSDEVAAEQLASCQRRVAAVNDH